MKNPVCRFGFLCAAFAALSFVACSDSNSGKTRTVANATMTCTELMYHPGENSVEFVELKLSGKALSSMSAVNLRLDGAVYFEFPDEALDTNEYIVVTGDTAKFRTAYPNFTGRLFGPWLEDDESTAVGNLSNNGDVLEIKLDGPGDFDARFDDDPPWPSLADGNGSSLVYVGKNPAYAESWAASKTAGGNPGSGDDPVYATSSVRINEVMPSDAAGSSWIEFYNAGSGDADIGGWELVRVDVADSVRFVPAGTTVSAGGYLVLDSLENASGDLEAISLMTRGEALYLREVSGGATTGVESSLEYAAVSEGQTAGVIVLSDGSSQQGNLATATKGSANAGISLGPIYISEVHYNPFDGDVEFLEIVNKGDSSVTLKNFIESDASTGYVPWKISGVAFDIGAKLAAGEVALLLPGSYTDVDGYTSVDVDTAAYRSKYKLPDSVQIFQYSGKLSNRGELVSIGEPMTIALDLNGSAKIYYRISDAILYSDDGLWPEEADGEGYSLHRIDYAVSGYEPSNWDAAAPTPGTL